MGKASSSKKVAGQPSRRPGVVRPAPQPPVPGRVGVIIVGVSLVVYAAMTATRRTSAPQLEDHIHQASA
jgi:hypothetical protein